MTAATWTNATASKRAFAPFAWMACAYETLLERQALAKLDDDALADIGVSYRDAQREAKRPFWDVPSHWVG